MRSRDTLRDDEREEDIDIETSGGEELRVLPLFPLCPWLSLFPLFPPLPLWPSFDCCRCWCAEIDDNDDEEDEEEEEEGMSKENESFGDGKSSPVAPGERCFRFFVVFACGIGIGIGIGADSDSRSRRSRSSSPVSVPGASFSHSATFAESCGRVNERQRLKRRLSMSS